MSTDDIKGSEEETRAIKQRQDEVAEQHADGEEEADEENLEEETA